METCVHIVITRSPSPNISIARSPNPNISISRSIASSPSPNISIARSPSPNISLIRSCRVDLFILSWIPEIIIFEPDEVNKVKIIELAANNEWYIVEDYPDIIEVYPKRGSKGISIVNFKVITDVNESLDIPINVEARTLRGNSSVLSIVHEGKREIFNVKEGEFRLSDGRTLNVLKEKYKNK